MVACSPGSMAIRPWLPTRLFLRRSDGSLVAFWLLNGTDARQAPVVHLGSEGCDNRVLAKNFQDFLQLFGVGYDELGFDDLNQPQTIQARRKICAPS